MIINLSSWDSPARLTNPHPWFEPSMWGRLRVFRADTGEELKYCYYADDERGEARCYVNFGRDDGPHREYRLDPQTHKVIRSTIFAPLVIQPCDLPPPTPKAVKFREFL